MFTKSLRRAMVAATAAASIAGFSAQQALAQDEEENVVVAEATADEGNEVNVEVKVVQAKSAPKRWLGIQLKNVEGDLATHLGSESGVFVVAVISESPAEAAGLKPGDVIKAVESKEIAEPGQLLAVMSDLDDDSSDILELTVIRQGDETTFKVTPAERPNRADIPHLEEHEQAFRFDLNSDTEGDITKWIEKIGDQEFKVLKFGGPAFKVNRDSKKDIDITVNKSEDGQTYEVQITRKDDKPAKIIVKTEDEVTEFDENELAELPESIRVMVEPILKQHQVRVHVAGEDGEMTERILAFVEDGENSFSLKNKEMAERVRAMAAEAAKRAAVAREKSHEAADRARAEASRARLRVRKSSEDSVQIEELRSQVEALKAELETLRKQLNDK